MGRRRALSDELEKYGYVFSLKKSLFSYLLTFSGLFLLGRFFGLHAIGQILLFGAGVFLLPLFIRNTWKNRYYQRKFSDLNIYMEQFLYSFRKTGKVLTTLEDVLDLFEKGNMKATILAAIDHIQNTYNEVDFEEKALRMIEKEYPYEGLRTMHRFAIRTESVGGQYQESIQLLLDARRMWADRVYELMQAKRKKRQEVILSILTSLLLCSMIYYMAGRMGLDVADNLLAQAVTVMVLFLDLLIYYKTDQKLTAGYLAREDGKEKETLQQYLRMRKYGHGPLSRLGQKAAKKNVTREIEKKFPEWLMEISLLLQTENVQVAIFRSYETAPLILQPALLQMIGKLKANPNDRSAYTDFLSEFTLPEVRSSMKMLYSISEGSGGDARLQIADIIRRNQKLLDKAEKMKDEDTLAGMYALFLAPQLTGGMKLMVDMILLFAVYLGNMAASGT